MAERKKSWPFPIVVAFLLLGLLLSIQFRTQQVYLRDLAQQQSGDLVQMLSKLHDKKGELDQELSDIEQQQSAINLNTNTDQELASTIGKESGQNNLAVGLTPVQGSGITVTINNDSPIVYSDLVDLTNELWASNAEAIAINDIRLTPWSGIAWDQSKMTMTVGGQRLNFPIIIKAIGNPDGLESGLKLLGGVIDNLAVYKVYPQIAKSSQLELPAGKLPELQYLSAK